jgi:hypothetical protein
MQDEPVDGLSNWGTTPDSNGVGTKIAQVRSDQSEQTMGMAGYIIFILQQMMVNKTDNVQ